MGFLDHILGERGATPRAAPESAPPQDAQAISRYRYLLRTAPPDAIEQAHSEAFAQLTHEQRAQVLRNLSEVLPADEKAIWTGSDDPKSLARMATRAEVKQPGTLERVLGGERGMGSMMGGSLLTSVAGAFIGSAIAHQLFGGFVDASAGESGTKSASGESADGEDEDAPGDVNDDVGDFED